MATLSLQRVEKRFDAQSIIEPIDLEIAQGEFAVFVGPSGCGKTTLLRMIAGLESVSAGRILIDGRDVTQSPPAQRGVAMVFQNYALYPHMNVAENIGFGLRIAGMPKALRDAKVLEAARKLQLEPLLQRKPKALSGGQRQRVAIGRAIVKEPGLFLFDEPLSNLDAELRQQTRLEIARLHRDLGTTMIYVTHDQVEAMTLADRIVVLRQGRIEQVGAPIDLYRDPDSAFVGGFIGSPRMNFLDGTIDSLTETGATILVPGLGSTIFPTTRLRSRPMPGAPVSVGIRPEHLLIEDGASGFAGRIEIVERLGSVSHAHLTAEGGARVTLERRGAGDAQPGDLLRVRPDPDGVFLFDPATGRRL
jgi:ABC-type sugar transport system ATPase subunit